eukprot:c18851_g2_i3 orf=1134-2222(+)
MLPMEGQERTQITPNRFSMFITGSYNRSNLPGVTLCQQPSRLHLLKCYGSEREMLLSARDSAQGTLQPGSPRIAFLFLVRRFIPHEPLWRRFFAAYDDLYSIYVHAKPGFKFPKKSFFSGREIPSKPVQRFSFNVVDAMRRLIANALLDTSVPNTWFVFVCESTIPVRSFPYVYNYLMNSNLSFVESLPPLRSYYSWNTLPEFPRRKLRKGELWMALQRRHASMVVAESTLYTKFKKKCKKVRCTPDEQYIQTLLAIKDPTGISNRTIMYVDWSKHQESGSPVSYTKKHISPHLIHKIQKKTVRLHVHRKDTTPQYCNYKSLTVEYNVTTQKQPIICFLFARKFTKDATTALQRLAPAILGY